MFSLKETNTLRAGTHKDCLKIAKSSGGEYQPVWFDYCDWEVALSFVEFQKGAKFPSLHFGLIRK